MSFLCSQKVAKLIQIFELKNARKGLKLSSFSIWHQIFFQTVKYEKKYIFYLFILAYMSLDLALLVSLVLSLVH